MEDSITGKFAIWGRMIFISYFPSTSWVAQFNLKSSELNIKYLLSTFKILLQVC